MPGARWQVGRGGSPVGQGAEVAQKNMRFWLYLVVRFAQPPFLLQQFVDS